MNKKSKQNWAVGNEVRVGFLTLIVEGVETHTNCYGQVIYRLANKDSTKKYTFSPYYGLDRIS